MKVHHLKVWSQFFPALKNGKKTFEYRTNDRDFQLGDILLLQEWKHEIGFTDQVIQKEITYIFQDCFDLPKGKCILGLKDNNEKIYAIFHNK